MAKRVLLVDPDVDALGTLASALRARGLTVFIASDIFQAVEQAYQSRPHVLLAAKSIDADGDLTAAVRAVPELATTPLLYLVRAGESEELGPNEVLRADLDLVISRITKVSRPDSRAPLSQELRGTFEQMPLVDLLQMLAMNRRSGVLGINTRSGAGEVRLAEGEVVDALYRRLEGEKALFRLLDERDGRFAFTAGDPPKSRRILLSTSQLLMEAMHHVDEVKRRRSELVPEGEALLFDDAQAPAVSSRMLPRPDSGDPLKAEIAALLQTPRSLSELIDEIGAPDLVILDAVAAMMERGTIRRIPLAELTTPFAPPEQLPMLRALLNRLTRPGFAPPPRLLIVAPVQRMPALAHAVRHIAETIVPNEPLGCVPLPRPLGALRLGDHADLELIGLPSDDFFSPLWALVIPGAAVVIRLADAGGAALEAHCEAVEVPLIEAESVMGTLDPAVPGQVAALVRSALELATGV